MCRIAGLISGRPDAHRLIEPMIGAMAHGGPDDDGIYSVGRVTFGHRRLSIIDLSSAGHQPMIDPDGGACVSYNGEIYNYRELRRELESSGQTFRSNTDTEVIIAAYHTWGISAFARLSGMFAFSLYDPRLSLVYLVRDANGIKPLYYSAGNDEVVFASEIKALKAFRPAWPEHSEWKKLFLTFGFLPHPYTSLKGVRCLTPGAFLEVNVGSLHTREVNFTESAPPRKRQHNSQSIDLQDVRASVIAATRRHLISDAPLGVFLSGGIDSSLLTLLASNEVGDQLRTVSVNFRESMFDESAYQRMVLGSTRSHEHHAFVVDEEMFWNAWDDLWRSMDQPSIDGVNSYFVSRSARESGLKAVLSGLGADELFGGYSSFARISRLKTLRRLPAKRALAGLAGKLRETFKRFVFLEIPGAIGDYLFLRGIHTPDVVSRVLQCDEREVWELLKGMSLPVPEGLDDLGYASFLETNVYMRSQLLKDTDYMSMRFGLEVRVPFLDQELLRTVHSIGLSGNFSTSHPKYLLTHAFADVLPAEIIHRKKQGFVFPFHLWLANGLNSGRQLMSERLRSTLDTDRFLTGRLHWSKCWSGSVLENFKA